MHPCIRGRQGAASRSKGQRRNLTWEVLPGANCESVGTKNPSREENPWVPEQIGNVPTAFQFIRGNQEKADITLLPTFESSSTYLSSTPLLGDLRREEGLQPTDELVIEGSMMYPIEEDSDSAVESDSATTLLLVH